jgi:hypothetical protein
MRWIRKTLHVLLALVLLGASLYLYVENIFLPVQFKRFITDKAQGLLNRPVTIGEIHFNPLRGFVIEGITVYQKDSPALPFIQIDEVSLNIFLSPVFSQKAVIIPAIYLKRPFIHILRQGATGGSAEQTSWNFSDLLRPPGSAPPRKTFIPLIRKIIVEEGEVIYADQTREKKFLELINGINLDARISLNGIIRFKLEALIPRRESGFQVKGNYALSTHKLSSHILAKNIALAEYLALFPTEQTLMLKNGALTSADLSLTLDGREIQSQGSLRLENITLSLPGNREIKTDLHAADARIAWHNNRMEASGRVESSLTQISLAADNTINGKLSAEIRSLDIFQQKITARGNLTIQEASWSMGENPHFTSQNLRFRGNILRADNILFKKEDSGLRLEAALAVEAIDFKAPPGTSVLGSLTTRKTEFLLLRRTSGFQGEEWHIQTDLLFRDSRIAWGTDQSLRGDLLSDNLSLAYAGEIFNLKGRVSLREVLLQATPQIQFQGSPGVDLTYQYNPGGSKDKHLYGGTLSLSRAAISGIPTLGKIQDVNGQISFQADQISTEELSFRAHDAAIALTGRLTDFTDPRLDIKASSANVDLERVFSLFPVLHEKSGVQLKGMAGAKARYTGALRNPAEAEITLALQMKDATLATPRLPEEITAISGQLEYQKDLVVWKDLQGMYQRKLYVLNGRLINFSRPTVDLDVASEDVKLSTKVKILHQAFQIASLTGQYLHTTFDLKGDVHFPEEDNPDLDIRGNIVLDLEDLAAAAPQLRVVLDRLNPTGRLAIEGIYKGSPKDWRHWQMTFTAQTALLSLGGYQALDAEIQYNQRDQNISKCNLRGRIYGGTLDVISSFDLRSDDIILNSIGRLENLDLSQMRKEKAIDNEHLSGYLSSLIQLSGPLQNPKKLAGTGSLAIADGCLWRWSLLDGILGALIIPRFRNIVFTDAHANFTVENGKIDAEEVWLDSSTFSLKGKGWIDFDQNIQFDISPVFGELDISGSGVLPEGPASILSEAEHYISLKLTGTLTHPKYKVETFPLKILGKTADVVTEGLKGGAEIIKEGLESILDEIF